MERLAKASESISDGVMFEMAIHKEMMWGLSPAHAITSSILPAHYMHVCSPSPSPFLCQHIVFVCFRVLTCVSLDDRGG